MNYDKVIERFLGWAREHNDIRAAIIVGSRARQDRPADALSDLDLVVVTTNPAATMDLFRRLARETAELRGLDYPVEADERVSA